MINLTQTLITPRMVIKTYHNSWFITLTDIDENITIRVLYNYDLGIDEKNKQVIENICKKLDIKRNELFFKFSPYQEGYYYIIRQSEFFPTLNVKDFSQN